MLNRGNLLISECPALGKSATKNAGNLADALILRQEADDAEFENTRREYQKHSIVSGKTLVIDSRGVHLRKTPQFVKFQQALGALEMKLNLPTFAVSGQNPAG